MGNTVSSAVYVPLADYLDALWPQNILTPPSADQIGKVWIEPPKIETDPELNIKTALLIEEELALSIPGVDGVSIVLAAAGNDSAFLFEFFTSPSPGMKVLDIPIAIRFAPDLLKPATVTTDAQGNQVLSPDLTQDHVDITLAKITLSASFDGGFGVDAEAGIDLPPCYIGDTGVGIEAKGIRFVSATDTPPPGKPAGWSGIHIPNAGLWLPGELGSTVGHLSLTDATIGNGGFSGTVTDTWSPALAASLGGIDLQLNSVAISFVQNSFTQCDIHGMMTLPFFNAPVGVEIGINLDGSFGVKLDSPSGLLTLNKPGILDLEVHSLGFTWSDDVITVALSGKVKPLVGGLDWPGFDVRELSIDSKGNVKVDGGWIDLHDGYALDFHGFKVEITRIGFGKNDDGGKWIGFSGSMNLVDGLSAGASVDGLKVIWYEDGSHDPKITLDGVGVEFLVPDVVSFKGKVAYHELTDASGATVHQFDGDIRLKLLALGLEVDAVLVIGTSLGPDGHAFTFFAIYIGVELPAGIPLWSTGLALYGLAGLFALRFEPDKHSDEEWYGIGPSDGWYKRPAIGVTDLAHKWRASEAGEAVGGGLTLGTVADNGFTFSGRMVLVLVFPGPILMIEGKANLLRERSKLSDEPIFRALAVLDGRAGTLLFGLDAHYKEGSGGELLDIQGSAEGFYDFHDADRWHLYLGIQDPKEKRIRAKLFKLFEADSYFMLDAHSLRTGAWVGYDKSWHYGPVKISLQAWLETNVSVSRKPVHFHGDLWAHGKVEMKVFGFGFGMSLDAKLAGDVFDPFHLLAELKVELDLPWPIPNVHVDLKLEWGPEPTPPPIPMVLKEVAIEHLKVSTSWPLPRANLLLPNYDQNGFIGPPVGPSVPADLSMVPIVPLDCRPHLTFGQPVHDAALIGNNPQPPNPPLERIGDPSSDQGPATVKYILKGVTLEKLSGGVWSTVARKADTPNDPGVPELYGSWAPVPGSGGSATQSVGQVKLWLWSKNTFDYTRNTSGAWDEWFTDTYPLYPCILDAPGKQICCDFTRYAVGAPVDEPQVCDPDMILVCFPPSRVEVERVDPPIDGIDRAACFLTESFLQVRLAGMARHVDIHLVTGGGEIMSVDFGDHVLGSLKNPFNWHGLKFTVFDQHSAVQALASVHEIAGARCLDGGFRTEINLSAPAERATVTIVREGGDSTLEGFDPQGRLVASAGSTSADPQVHEVVLDGPGIARIDVTTPSSKTAVLSVDTTPLAAPLVMATADFADGTHGGPFMPVNGHIIVDAAAISAVTVRGRGTFCVLNVCAAFGPDPKDIQERQEMEQHLQSSTTQWSQVGDVLEPNSIYRLTILTRVEATGEGELAGWSSQLEQMEIAYFQTEGPPGLCHLSIPVDHPTADKFDSGLSDLTRYVKQTVPATVPPPGLQALLPKPVYRAYDVGVEFNEDYVDLMYRISGRDLGLYLFDNNHLPVRDAAGRLIARPNEWGTVDTVTLDATDIRWIEVVNASTCAIIDASKIPRDMKLSAGSPEQVLAASTLYEARLVPLLLHETFAGLTGGTTAAGPGGRLGRWQIVDQGTLQGPSIWQIAETPAPVTRYVIQTSPIWGGTQEGTDPVKPGSMLILGPDPNLPDTHPDQPAQWTDYRLTTYLRNEDNGAIGLIFRYMDPHNYYRFSMDAQRGYRRLVRVVNGAHTILDEDDRRHQQTVDYAVTVEAIGPALRVYVDGELILESGDPSHAAGGIGIYCWASAKARFFDVAVDDFRAEDPAAAERSDVYRFPFTTSQFAHFTHQVQSFDDRSWDATLDPGAAASNWMAAAVDPHTAIADAESRAYDALVTSVSGSNAGPPSTALNITRVIQSGRTIGFLVEAVEPFDWSRIDLQLLFASPAPKVTAAPPDTLKLVAVSFGRDLSQEESVGVLTRDAIDLRGHTIESFVIPGPIKGGLAQEYLFEDFNQDGHGVLFEETFGPNALDRYAIVDQGNLFAPSKWASIGGAIQQTTHIGGGSLDPADVPKLGTMAVTGDPRWSSMRMTCRLLSTDNKALGVVFRYRDEKNYYRFSSDHERSYRRLVKCVDGKFTLLWEDTSSYLPNVAFELQIEACGDRIVGQMDHQVLFDINDDAQPMGRVGFYSWLNAGSHFQRLRIEALESDPVLLRPNTTALERWIILDPDDAVDAPSAWTADAAGIHQTSNIRVENPDQVGAHLVTGQRWDDLQLSADLCSEQVGTMGVLFRYRDKSNYYRFSMDASADVRRLVKCVAGIMTTLWQDTSSGYDTGRTYRLSLCARGSTLSVYLDGAQILTVVDTDISKGSVGLYTWNNGSATFNQMWVLDLATYVGDLRVFDGSALGGESTWRTRYGELQQRSLIGDPGAPQLGTHAIAPLDAPSVMRLAVQARSDTGMPIGVLFRYEDERNYYRFSVSTTDHMRTLIKMVAGTPAVLWQTPGGYSPGVDHLFTVDTFGSRLVGYLDAEKQFDLTDGDLSAGRIGVYVSRDDTAAFGSISVSEPPIEAAALFTDSFSQGNLSDWTFVSEATLGGPPNWATASGVLTQTSDAYQPPTDAGDVSKQGLFAVAGDPTWGNVVFRARVQSDGDGAIGIMFRYQDQNHYYRFSLDRGQKYRRLVKNVGGTFTLLWEDALPPEPGRSCEIVIVTSGDALWGYADRVPMFVVRDPDLIAGCIGLYCWRNSGAKFSGVAVLPIDAAFDNWAFKDNFPYLVVDRWSFTDAGDVDGPGGWAVQDHCLVQTSAISGNQPYQGTYAVSDEGSRDWTDYRFAAGLASSTAGVMGIAARYRDPENHYRFEIGLDSSRRLVKVVAGQQTELWSDTTGYEKDRPLVAAIDCVEQRITCYVDGVTVCEVVDGTFEAGRVALFAFDNPAAKFSFVRVQEAGWEGYYRFGKGPAVPAGRRIRVLACAEADAPDALSNTQDLFVAGPGEQGDLHFLGSGCDLRIVDVLGKVQHTRTFLRSSRYSPIAGIKVLRNADGTAFFLCRPSMPPEESGFDPAEYRFQLTYRRDNAALDATSPIQRESGSVDPEETQVDFSSA